MKAKFNQNVITETELYMGMSKGFPIYKTFKVVTTNKSVIVYNSNGEIYGMSRVACAEDFDYDVMLNIALEKSGSKIKVA